MQCQRIPEHGDFSNVCPAQVTHRAGRRLYCREHAPEGAVLLDRFVNNSAMTAEDKAKVYDQIAEHLRKQGWEVMQEGRMPDDGRIVQMWQHAAHGTHTLTSAYKVECYLDAPRIGPRFLEMMSGLNKAMDRKERLAETVDATSSERIANCPYKSGHDNVHACVDCGYLPSGKN